MNALRCLLALAPLALLAACKGVTIDVGSGYPEPLPPPAGQSDRYPDTRPSPYPDHRSGHPRTRDPYAHMVKRQSFTAMASTRLKEGCYAGDFKLGRSQIRVSGLGADRTVINGDLILQTQCKVSDLTVTGNVVFDGHQAELTNVDFFGQVIDRGSQNRY